MGNARASEGTEQGGYGRVGENADGLHGAAISNRMLADRTNQASDPVVGASGVKVGESSRGAVDAPSRSSVSKGQAGRVNKWALPGEGVKPRSPEVTDEVFGSLAALGDECYRLRVKASVDLMDALVRDTSWVENAALVCEVSGQETEMASRLDA